MVKGKWELVVGKMQEPIVKDRAAVYCRLMGLIVTTYLFKGVHASEIDFILF